MFYVFLCLHREVSFFQSLFHGIDGVNDEQREGEDERHSDPSLQPWCPGEQPVPHYEGGLRVPWCLGLELALR